MDRASRFNIFDIVFLSVVIFYLSGGMFSLFNAQAFEYTDARVEFFIEKLPYDDAYYLTEADAIRIDFGNQLYGNLDKESLILDIYQKPYAAAGGGVVFIQDREYASLRGSFLCSGRFTEYGFLLGKNRFMAPNMTFHVKFESLEAQIYIFDIAFI